MEIWENRIEGIAGSNNNNKVWRSFRRFRNCFKQRLRSNDPINIQGVIYKSKFDALSIWTKEKNRCFKTNVVFTATNISLGESSTIHAIRFLLLFFPSLTNFEYSKLRNKSKTSLIMHDKIFHRTKIKIFNSNFHD